MTRFRTRCGLLSGCTTLQYLSLDDLRQPNNLRRGREPSLTLDQIPVAIN